MNEVRAIVEAFDEADAAGERTALATLVSVEGSSYRRPGARMLVREGGETTGTISAGCLEADVTEHALRVIKGGAARLVEYDTASTSDEIVWGLGLGCNGIVRVLVEPLAAGSPYVAALRRTCAPDAAHVTVATVFRHTPARFGAAGVVDANGVGVGARVFLGDDGETVCDGLRGELARAIESDLLAAAHEEPSGVRVYEAGGGRVEVFVETLAPPVALVVFGAGHDALPVVELARGLGWQTEVVDTQARPASLTRFASADRVTLARPETLAAHVRVTPRTLALVMSHNYAHDLASLRFLLSSPARYVGIMGPRKRTERMLSELAEGDDLRLGEDDWSRLHAPAGLDIGAAAPAEIALSIVAEMRAFVAGRRGGMLRERRGSIHGDASEGERVHATEGRDLNVAVA